MDTRVDLRGVAIYVGYCCPHQSRLTKRRRAALIVAGVQWRPISGTESHLQRRATCCDDICFRSFRLALGKAKIDDFHFHDLRHTFATRSVQAGVDLYKVQRLLGHKSPIMTQRYAHHYPESLRDGVAILDRVAVPGTNLVQSAGSPTAAVM